MATLFPTSHPQILLTLLNVFLFPWMALTYHKILTFICLGLLWPGSLGRWIHMRSGILDCFIHWLFFPRWLKPGLACSGPLENVWPNKGNIWSRGNFTVCISIWSPPQILYHLSHQRICLQCRRLGFDPWVRKIPWRREWLHTPAFLPGKFYGQRSLVGSPRGHKELDTTKRLTLFTWNYLFNVSISP